MKKILSFVLAVLVVVSMFSLTACGSVKENPDVAGSKYVGTWDATRIEVKGETGQLSEALTLTLNDDGTGVYSSSEGDQNVTWVLIDGGFKTKGGVKFTFKDNGDDIRAKILGVDIVFERVDAAAEAEVEETAEAAVAEETAEAAEKEEPAEAAEAVEATEAETAESAPEATEDAATAEKTSEAEAAA